MLRLQHEVEAVATRVVRRYGILRKIWKGVFESRRPSSQPQAWQCPRLPGAQPTLRHYSRHCSAGLCAGKQTAASAVLYFHRALAVAIDPCIRRKKRQQHRKNTGCLGLLQGGRREPSRVCVPLRRIRANLRTAKQSPINPLQLCSNENERLYYLASLGQRGISRTWGNKFISGRPLLVGTCKENSKRFYVLSFSFVVDI
jgi:hypothetical protein